MVLFKDSMIENEVCKRYNEAHTRIGNHGIGDKYCWKRKMYIVSNIMKPVAMYILLQCLI